MFSRKNIERETAFFAEETFLIRITCCARPIPSSALHRNPPFSQFKINCVFFNSAMIAALRSLSIAATTTVLVHRQGACARVSGQRFAGLIKVVDRDTNWNVQKVKEENGKKSTYARNKYSSNLCLFFNEKYRHTISLDTPPLSAYIYETTSYFAISSPWF